MRVFMRIASAALLGTLFALGPTGGTGRAAQPLSAGDIVRLVELQIDDAAIISKVKKEGTGFPVTDAALARLKAAGASDALLEAIRASAKSAPVPAGGGKVVSYADVVKLLELGIDEAEILKRLARSPTLFTLGAAQVRELKQKGASDALLAALQGRRGGPTSSDVTDFVVILDCSGSMKARTKDGSLKMAAAKQVVTDLIRNIPDGLNLAFIVYGHEVFSHVEDARNCRAVKVVRPLSELDARAKQELASFIASLQPTGATPIALALETAGAELGRSTAFSGIVLITDGMETCHGDPSAEATRLAANSRLTFGLNVVGFDVDKNEQAAVEGIAKAAGDKGRYYNARTAAELKDMVGKLHKDLVAASPAQRRTEGYSAAGTAVKPGAFLHDAPLVGPGEYKGALPMMSAWYYQVAVRKGQELRAVGQIQKTPYRAGNNVNHQIFGITIYAPDLQVGTRETLDVEGNPTAVSSLRATWTAERDGVAWVAISATGNQDKAGQPQWIVGDALPASSAYTLRIRLDGEASGDAPRPIARATARAGRNFEQAGEIPLPGLATCDLKLKEVAFYRVKVIKGDTLHAGVAVQKPFYNAGNGDIRATYTVTVYDDDQVQVEQKKGEVKLNPADARTLAVDWPVTLAGYAYVSVACENSGQRVYPNNFDPQPGHVVVQVTTDATAADGKDPFRGAKSESR